MLVVKRQIILAMIVQMMVAGLFSADEVLANSAKIEDVVARLVIVEFKDGSKGSGILVKETPDAVYLADPDGSMETSFSRDNIISIRKPTSEEMERLKEALVEEADSIGPAGSEKPE